MGFALPTGTSAAMATNAPVAVIAGHGGFKLNIQGLQTIARNNLPVKIIVINNQCQGMARRFQDSYFKGRVQSTVWGYSAPSFSAVAAAYGIPAATIADPSGVLAALEPLWRDASSPGLKVIIPLQANAYPENGLRPAGLRNETLRQTARYGRHLITTLPDASPAQHVHPA